MSVVLGLAIANDRVRAVAVRAERVVWFGEAELESHDRIADVVAKLLSAALRGRMRRPSVVVAIGPSFTQTRVIGGLPPMKDTTVLARIIREGTSRFFLQNGIPLVTGNVRVIEPGRVWASAFDEPVVNAAIAGCRAARFRVRAVVPTTAVLGAAFEVDQLLWGDGPVHAEIEIAHGDVIAVRRRPHVLAEDHAYPSTREALSKIGVDAWRFADAYGAAVRASNPPLALKPGRGDFAPSEVPRWRLGVAAMLALGASVVALAAPGFVAQARARAAEARLAELAEARSVAVVAETQLARFTTVLNEVAAFDAERRSITMLLADITRVLPDGNAIVTFRVDSAGGTIVAVAPRAAGVVAALEDVPGIVSPQIVGPVTRERVGERELERITVRFLLANREPYPSGSMVGGDDR